MLSGANLRQPWGHSKLRAGEKHSQETVSPSELGYWSLLASPAPALCPLICDLSKAHAPSKEHPLEAHPSPMLYLLPLQSKLFTTEDLLESSVPVTLISHSLFVPLLIRLTPLLSGTHLLYLCHVMSLVWVAVSSAFSIPTHRTMPSSGPASCLEPLLNPLAHGGLSPRSLNCNSSDSLIKWETPEKWEFYFKFLLYLHMALSNDSTK